MYEVCVKNNDNNWIFFLIKKVIIIICTFGLTFLKLLLLFNQHQLPKHSLFEHTGMGTEYDYGHEHASILLINEGRPFNNEI